MKNYLITSLKISAHAALLLVLSMLTQGQLFAQPDATASAIQTTFCAELGTDLVLMGSSTTNPVMYNWTGPDGFTSTDQNPTLAITSVDQEGDYCLVTQDAFEQFSVESCVTITVTPLIEMECPESIIVTPDLAAGAGCATDLSNFSFTIDAINCTGNFDYCISLTLEDGTAAIASGGPVTGTQLIGTGTYPQAVGGNPVSYTGLPFGFHTLAVDIKDVAATIVSQCLTEVRVMESVNNVVCNDAVNLTLTNDCQATVTPDMILQGDYCFDNFQISMDGVDPTDQIMLSEPGVYTISVSNSSGITCWGTVLAEDKTIPQVECQNNVTMYCSQTNFVPGSSVCGYGKFTNTVTTAAAGTPVGIPLDLLSGSLTGTVKDLRLNIAAEVAAVNDMSFSLISPEGTSIQLADFADPALATVHCMRPNLCISLADNPAYLPYDDFFGLNQCNAQVNAYRGNFNPLNALAGFNGDDAVGGTGWELQITSASTVSEIAIELIVLTDEGSLVTAGDIMQNQGCNSSDIRVEPEDEMLSDNCAGGYWSVVRRTWTATNFTNGQFDTCSQTITFLPWTLEDLIFPQSRDGVKGEVIDCSEIFDADWNIDLSLADEDGNPLPALTGYPTVPFGEMCGNFEVTYEDLIFELCGDYSRKIVRKWAVFDWCESEFVEFDQILKIEDTTPIQMTCAPDSNEGITVNDSNGNPITDSNGDPIIYWPGVTDGDQCAGTWDIVPPLVIQNACDAHVFDFTVEFLIADEDGEPPLDGDYVMFDPETGASVDSPVNPTQITNLPAGVTWLRYSVEDECGNTGVCFTEVAIVDETSPTPVCIENTVVAIGDDGCAYLPAEAIDNNSWDNCGVIATREISRSSSSGFTDILEYCCGCMLNDEETVFLRVTDDSGNSNTCRVFVEVQNNMSPQVSGSPQATISQSCTAGGFDLYSIAQQGINAFSFTADCPNNDPLDFTVEATLNGQPIFQGDTFEPGECGVGSATIKYEVFDGCSGNRVGGEVNQTLSFTNSLSSFRVNQWPEDITLDNCLDGVEPENLPSRANADNIRATATACGSDTAISYEDQVFASDEENVCYKIIRTWTVIDWCIVNSPGNTLDMGRDQNEQIIRINDNSAPVITNLNDVRGNDPSCQHLLTEDDVDYEVSDNCTNEEDIQLSYQINGNPTSQSIFGRFYDNGDRITIEATDHCGNTNTFSFGIFTSDEEPPTPYCNSEVVTTPNASGIAEIWVDDFSLGADDNCDPQIDDYFLNEFNEQTQVLTFDCSDIPNGVSELVPVTVYFEDDSGNVNTCEVRVFIQDPQDICPDGPGSRIAGRISTEDNAMVENAMVELMRGEFDMADFQMTANDGVYHFSNVAHESNYSIAPYMIDSYLNGVSTIDLVQIQRHILGLERFTSPYKIIAADSDNNGRINGTDLVELRKLILGVTTELPFGQQAWRLPIESQSFADPASPFPYKETINVEDHNAPSDNQNFIAVKIGDVNGSALAIGRRSARSLELVVAETELNNGEQVTIPVYAKDISDLIGLQTTMSFNPTALEFVGITKGALEISEANLGMHSLTEGYITLSWNNITGVAISNDEALFELQFNVNESSKLSEQFFLSSALTDSEAYTSDMETMNLHLNYANADISDFILYQNIPNPFAGNTEIRFSLPASSDVTFTVYNVNGSEILRRTSRYEGGNNSILLSSEELTSSGLLYYKLETAYGTASKKMIQIR